MDLPLEWKKYKDSDEYKKALDLQESGILFKSLTRKRNAKLDEETLSTRWQNIFGDYALSDDDLS